MNSKISFTTMATPELDLPAQALAAREYGFHGIDFRVGQPGRGEVPEDPTAEQIAFIRSHTQGLTLPGLLCYNKNIHAGQGEMVSSLLANLRLAKRLDCPMIRVFTGKIREDGELETLCAALKTVLSRDESEVKLGLQIHMNNGVTVAQGLKVCQTLQSPRVGVILSPDQSVLGGEDWEPLLPEIAGYTFQIYVADIDGQGQFTLIGDGIIDYAGILKVLRSNGFDGYVTLKWEKCWVPQLPEYPQAFRSFLAYFSNSAR